MKISKSTFLLIAGGVGLFLLATMLKPFTIIGAGERGVVMSFGKVQDQELGEGIHPILPIVTSVRRLNVRVQKTDVQAQASSSDLQEVTTNVAINWHIDPERASEVFQRVGDLDTVVSSIISPAVSEVVKAATARRPVQAILQQRVDLKNEIDDALAKRLEPYGVIVDDVSLVDFGFSAEFKAAIEAKQVAEQEAQQAAFRAKQAEQEAQAEINRARGQAEAQRLLRQTLTREILQQRAIEKWNGQFPVVMTGEGGALPFINIDPNTLRQQPPAQPQ
ncbi:MAG TPA: prohibitin family protein [Synechococcales cyanobacterium M55_K2018_004]|nr:prohibitin family protein [Synechococcales cyanobacterium M55_K2018_004]